MVLLNVLHTANEVEVKQGVGIPQINGPLCLPTEIEPLCIHYFIQYVNMNMNMKGGLINTQVVWCIGWQCCYN